MASLEAITAVLVFCFINNVFTKVIVETKSGKIEGKEIISIIPDEKYFSFLGIPYAKPPIGSLRFMPSSAHPGWENILKAKKEKKHCPQLNFPISNIQQFGSCGDEDCLYLNIHTPKLPQNEFLKFPVIVFLNNELFKISFNNTKDYGPDFFMYESVIVVTVSHRIGALGFLSFEDELIPGNNGIKDVILALEWLKENIIYFGGDSSRVTLMGHHGGAALADILLKSPKARGLFSGVILQSGSSFFSEYFDNNSKKRAIALSEELKTKATTSSSFIERLSSITSFEITEVEAYVVHADEGRAMQRGVTPFGPVVEIEHPDAVITKLPEDNPTEVPVPVMIGFNSRESMEINLRYLRSPQYLTFADRDFLMIFPIRTGYHFKIDDSIYYKIVQEIKDYYFDEGYVKISKPGEYLTYISDVTTIYPIDYTVRQYTNNSNTPIYYYMFDYSGELNFRKKSILEETTNFDGTWGASASDELCYLFVCKAWKNTYIKLLNEDAEEINVLKKMVKMYTDFAKTGNPTLPGSDFIWKPATKEKKECLVISDELKMLSNLYDDKIKFWDEFLQKYKDMAVDGVVKDDIKDEL